MSPPQTHFKMEIQCTWDIEQVKFEACKGTARILTRDDWKNL
jgi:hypothetical protein